MRQDKIVELGQGLRTAFVNQNEQSNLAYKPQFISNVTNQYLHSYVQKSIPDQFR